MKNYHKIIDTLKGMIGDGVQLVHGGNIIDWEETIIPELLEGATSKIDSEVPVGAHLKHKFTKQDYWVFFDDNKTLSLSTMHNVIYYPKEIVWDHFEEVKKENGHNND